MIDITSFRKSLGKKAEGLADTEVEKIMDMHYKLANVFFDLWVKNSKINNKETTVFVKYKKDGNLIFMYGKVYA